MPSITTLLERCVHLSEQDVFVVVTGIVTKIVTKVVTRIVTKVVDLLEIV